MRGGRSLETDYRIAALRVRLALLSALRASVKAGFRQDQPRDPDGRWSGGSGRVIVTRRDKTGDPKIDAKTDLLVDVVKEVVEKVGPGSGPLHGMRIHAEAAKSIRSLDLPGIGVHGVEQSFSGGDLVRYGLNGSVRTDVILRDGRTEAAPIRAVWDIKTGGATLSAQRVETIRERLGLSQDVPIIEIHIERGVGVKAVRIRYDAVRKHDALRSLT